MGRIWAKVWVAELGGCVALMCTGLATWVW